MTRIDVENALLKMDMPVGLLGFGYIVNAVLKLDTQEWGHGKIIALYAQIGKECNTTGSRVERAIRHSLETVRKKGKPEFVEKYVGFDNTTNSDSIYRLHMILTHMNKENKNEK